MNTKIVYSTDTISNPTGPGYFSRQSGDINVFLREKNNDGWRLEQMNSILLAKSIPPCIVTIIVMSLVKKD